MSVQSGRVVLNTTTPELIFGPVEKELVLSLDASATCFIGGPAMSSATDSWLLVTGTPQTYALGRGDSLYGLADTGTPAVRFLAIGD